MHTLNSFADSGFQAGGPTVLGYLKSKLQPMLREQTPRDPREIFASATAGAGSGIGRFDELHSLVSGSLLFGFRGVSDTTQGWTTRVPLPDYKQAEVAIVDKPCRLSPIGHGTTAASVQFSLTSPQGWRLAKFGARFQIDEQDVLDGLRLEPLRLALAEIGAAAARLIPDLVYSLLFNNAALPDGVALFHSSRNNLGTSGSSELTLATLKIAYGKMAAQIPTDVDGNPVHLNLTPRYLITTPTIALNAADLVRQVLPAGLALRSESRISTTGVYDPLADETITSLNTAWMLAAPAEQAPSIIVGTLDGMTEPMIRSGPLSQGEWGQWFDVSFSVGVTAVSGRGLYFATGG